MKDKDEEMSVEDYLKKTSVFNIGLSKSCEKALYDGNILNLYDLVTPPDIDPIREQLSTENIIELTELLGLITIQLLKVCNTTE